MQNENETNNERVYVRVGYHQKEKAKECGAKWDNVNKAWYVLKSEELFLLQFTNATKKNRKLWELEERLKYIFRMRNHRNNADITIVEVNEEREKEDSDRIDALEKRIKKLKKEIVKDHDVNYYIEQETKNNPPEIIQPKTKQKPFQEFSMSDIFG